ncbi:MDR/zinc-dependent alcohol dehydrogenase-like family protein [Enterobacter roggenkampii]|uniref:hypothetical protein n=1 Tax=Enterobacter roggenkampii TaxID=1812935 RepID=UPI002DB6EAD4|nr:hypothetical protein [Enterobacter roggenkampii]MEB5887493.1 hypothetical protein [Enterobacter roggenkampii]
MQAIAIIHDATDNNTIEFLQGVDLPMKIVTGHDLLVEVKSISVPPVDTKDHQDYHADVPPMLGWNAGALDHAGINIEFQLVDVRVTTLKQQLLDNASTASLPPPP